MPLSIDQKFIIEAEQQLGLQFPEAFRRHLMESNGGEIKAGGDYWQLHSIHDPSSQLEGSRDLVTETQNARKWAGFPADGVSIGSNGSGDHLLLIPQADAADSLGSRLYWFDHEKAETSLMLEDISQAFTW